jgi:hypothetical protein
MFFMGVNILGGKSPSTGPKAEKAGIPEIPE